MIQYLLRNVFVQGIPLQELNYTVIQRQFREEDEGIESSHCPEVAGKISLEKCLCFEFSYNGNKMDSHSRQFIEMKLLHSHT